MLSSVPVYTSVWRDWLRVWHSVLQGLSEVMRISYIRAARILLRVFCAQKDAMVQMGGAEGVRKAERYALVNGIAGGLRMHAIPRQSYQNEE